jgi:hypothetical protein
VKRKRKRPQRLEYVVEGKLHKRSVEFVRADFAERLAEVEVRREIQQHGRLFDDDKIVN